MALIFNLLFLYIIFKIVVLARVIHDKTHVWLTAVGISRLVGLLLHEDELVVVLTCKFLFFKLINLESFFGSYKHDLHLNLKRILMSLIKYSNSRFLYF